MHCVKLVGAYTCVGLQHGGLPFKALWALVVDADYDSQTQCRNFCGLYTTT